MYHRRRAALLTGLLTQGEQTPLTPEIAELTVHREQLQQQQLQRLQAIIQEDQQNQGVQVERAPVIDLTQAIPAVATAQDAHTIATQPQAAPQAAPSDTKPAEQLPAAPRKRTRQPFWRHLLPRHIPVIHQMSAVECGAACLAMMLSYYGRKTSVSEVRERCNVGRDGLSALDIVKAARNYNLRVRAITVREDNLKRVTLPAIIHWEFNHFIIVERYTAKWVHVVDPALGRRRLSHEEFFNGFTGIVVMLEPSIHFNRSSIKRKVTLGSYILNYITITPLSLVQIIGASLVLQALGLAMPVLTAIVVDQIVPLRLHDMLNLLVIGIGLLILAQVLMTLVRSSVLLYLQTKVDTQMLLSFFEHLISLPQRFFLQRSSGDILSRLNSNIVIRDTISNQLISTVLDGSLVIVYLLILLKSSLLFGLVVAAIGLVQVILLLVSRRLVHNLAKRELQAQGRAQGYATEVLVGITTLKAVGAEQRAMHKWTNLLYDQMNASVRRSSVSSLLNTVIANIHAAAPLALLLLGTSLVLNGQLQAGSMLALVTLAGSFLNPLGSLVSSSLQVQLVHSHLERIADVLEAQEEQDAQSVTLPPRLSGHVRLDNVSFQYDQQSPMILHNINLTIEAGQKVAIVGRTGSGKSTLGALLLGMYLPTQGEIFYDNIPLRTMNYQAVRSQFGVVTQGATIFSGTIRENIMLNNPTMSIQQMAEAASAAAIHQDILQMPMEYETYIAEGGTSLSGGQRQRVALARALANKPALLLFDEATSALDVVTERIVERNLRALQCTQIIIAHRLSTVRNADVILVIDEGKIVECGTHESLLQQQGYYARLIQSQLESSEVNAVADEACAHPDDLFGLL
ncbi:MAG: peptidase domain-containing ABC transporter [Chloroflexi bacterium]|nr:MAG: peptidase domain-containing ABC transporter [Chloroflexota bacterium]